MLEYKGLISEFQNQNVFNPNRTLTNFNKLNNAIVRILNDAYSIYRFDKRFSFFHNWQQGHADMEMNRICFLHFKRTSILWQ